MSYPASTSSQMSSSEDPAMLQQILSRYETEEDEFLREIESMQQCSNTDTSDDLQEESPVLGTLCSLVGEIGQLRRENRKLRRRLAHPKPSYTAPAKPTRNPAAAMVNRVGALLDSRYLPKFMGGSNSLGASSKRYAEVRTGARERLSSPPHKDSLTVSSYSTDFSSDSFSSTNRRRKAPPLVLPEMSDSDAEQPIFQEVTLPNYEQSVDTDENGLSPCRPRRTMARRSHIASVSDHTSPSTASMSGSSVEPSEAMTSSRSSFLEFIGIRRRRDNDSSSSSTTKEATATSSKPGMKKRKRKISESESVASAVLHSTVPKSEKRLSAVLAGDAPAGQVPSGQLLAAGSDSWLTTAHEPSGQPNKQTSKSLKSFASGRQPRRADNSDGASFEKKTRPKSVAYLDPGDHASKSSLKTKTKSCKSVSSRGTTASEDTNQSMYTIGEDVQLMRDENSLLRTEIQVLKTRNNRLIDQLREKSMQMSKLQTRTAQMELELKEANKRECFSEAVENVCLKERLMRGTRELIDSVEDRLRQYEAEIQNVKAEATKIQQTGLSTAVREQNAYQTALEQVEKLQRDYFSMLQMQSNDLASQEKFIRQRLEIMPSYDALYSFTMGIVRKLSQMRGMLIERAAQQHRSELEVMQLQTSLLLTHAQMERQRNEMHLLKNRRTKRPVSYHGEDLLEHLAKPHLSFLLPFKLHGARVDKHRKSQQSSVIDNLVEANEQNIEIEFLRLFDYARCLSKVCDESAKPASESKTQMRTSETVIVYRNGRGTVSPMNSPIFAERRAMMDVSRTNKGSEKSKDKARGTRRPTSWVEANDLCSSVGGRKLTDGPYQRDGSANLPSLRNLAAVSRIGGCHQPVVSSLQDISCSSGLRSPSTTPILTRRIPLLGSPTQMKERRLVKQSSLQYPPTATSPYDNQPLYDSPPRSNTGTVSSSDYGTINSCRLQSQSFVSVAANIKRQPSLEKRPQKPHHIPADKAPNNHPSKSRPVPSAPPAAAVYQSKLPQPSLTSHSAMPGAGAAQRRAGAIMRRNNSPVLEIAQKNPSPLFPRQARHSMERSISTRNSASESPSFAVRFYHPIREEEELQSTSEATEPTTSSATLTAGTSCTTATITSMVSVVPGSSCSSSRLPQPTLRQERAAKKAGMSWLNRLRLSNKRTHN